MSGGRPAAAGSATIELALVLPLFLVLLFGIVEFGLILYAQGILTNASREGARYGVVYSTPRKSAAQIETWVRDYLRDAGFTESVTVAVTGAGGNLGDPLDVRVDYTYHFLLLPQFVASLGANLNLRAETVMRLE